MTNEPLSLLLVEDDTIDVELVRRCFRNVPYECRIYHAPNGIEALKMLRGQLEVKLPEDLIILLDLNLPRMSGLEFLRELRSDPVLKTQIVFVLSTSNDEMDKLAAYGLNISGYVVKSDSGSDFRGLRTLIESYWNVIAFPPNREFPKKQEMA